jgi:GTP 3',8-cyclase
MERLYLRLSVTDRCNLRCRYCMPADGVEPAPEGSILAFEEIRTIVNALHAVMPLRKLRVTGGEPLVRRDLPELVSTLSADLPSTRLCMTTNGALLDRNAEVLRGAGLSRVNVSLDTLDPQRYRELTRGGSLHRALQGIEAAQAAGLKPVKVNCVVQRGFNDDEVVDLVDFGLRTGVMIRFLELMPVGESRTLAEDRFVQAAEILERLSSRFQMRRLRDDGTATLYEAQRGSLSTQVGLITPVSSPFCGRCDRVRIDARGQLFACLHSADPVQLGPALRGSQPVMGLDRLLREALVHKIRNPAHRSGPMSAIGG